MTATIDTTNPDVTLDSAISDDTGSSATDRITSDQTLSLSGTYADANIEKVEIYDGATFLGNATLDGSGNWSFTTGTLIDGSHNLTAKAVDLAGNSTTTAPLTAVVDTTAPTVVLNRNNFV